MMRLFVAIELLDSARQSLTGVQEALRPKCPDVRWVRPEQLHLTVKYLGDVDDRDAAGVSEAISRAGSASKSFAMSVGECGCFPEWGSVRIVWAGVQEPSGLLASCVEATEGELESVGFAREERSFSPHITIGRMREDRSRGGMRSLVEAFHHEAVKQSVSSLTLMASVLSPKGPTYSVVSQARLGA